MMMRPARRRGIWIAVSILLLAIGGWAAWSGLTGANAREPFTRDGLRGTPLAPPAGGAMKFTLLDPAQTGVVFENWLRPQNVYPYMYNGAGLAVGDYDGNGLPDIYLVSQDGPNKLFAQRAPWRFEDVTAAAGVAGGDAWGSGASFADVDADGDLDLYVCNSEAPNLLYLNLGDGTFRDVAREWGVDISAASTACAFADYDRDGDLDLYLLTNRVLGPTLPPEIRNEILFPSRFMKTLEQLAPELPPLQPVDGEWQIPPELADHLIALQGRLFFGGQADHLLRNDGGRFTDVTAQAGISDHGMGLSATWWDYDDDGWLDLYIANDLESPDMLYHNRADGTFAHVTEEVLPKTAYFGMGSDAGDIDNDGRADLIVADMAMTTHKKAKWLMGGMSDRGWFLEHGRPQQGMRNMLFWNRGVGRMQEIAYLAGVAKTDWTWAVRFGDLDNDGWQDLFVTNGIARFDMDPDLNPRYAALVRAGKIAEALELARNVPPVPEKNLAFRNLGGLQFAKVAKEWGLDLEGVSHGAALCDFDRDGDLDIVVNNMNAPASLYRNDGNGGRRMLVQLEGDASERHGVGAKVVVETGGVTQTKWLTLARGYLSADEPMLQFGLGTAATVDRMTVHWPSGHVQRFEGLPADYLLVITEPPGPARRAPAPEPELPRFVEAARELGLSWVHEEQPFDDFRAQPLLPHRLSRMGPGIAIGERMQDWRRAIYIAGARGQRLRDYEPRQQGGYEEIEHGDGARESLGLLLFDVDGGGKLDLLAISGSVEAKSDGELRDLLLSGESGFGTELAFPGLADSGSCAAACDFDRDGDLDLFVGSFVIPGQFPKSPQSRLLRNDGGRFVDATAQLAPALLEAGLVTSAVWSDYDGDGWTDLLVTAHWQAPRVLRNEQGKLVDRTLEAGVAKLRGWWNSIAAGDLDGDGDLDYALGNFGLNTKYHATPEHPASLFCADFDQSGSFDVVEAKDADGTLLPVRGRSCSSQAMPFIAEKFESYEKFASANLAEIYTPQALDQSLRLDATELRSGWLRNDGRGKLEFVPFPTEAQTAPVFGIAIADLDLDGHADVVGAQNFYAPEPETGRMDGGLGFWLRGTGGGALVPVPPVESGIVIPQDARALVVHDVDGDAAPDLLVTTNDGPLRVLRNRIPAPQTLRIELQHPTLRPAAGARVRIGKGPLLELHAGSGYLSQGPYEFLLRHPGSTTLEVHWPDGARTLHDVVYSDDALVLTRE